MNSSICTLFEKHFHFGLGALTNSLYRYGFRGSIFAGYRGEFPSWAADAKLNAEIHWNGARTLFLNEGLQLHFLPVETEYHFANFKPDFMLKLINGPAKNMDNLAYFDPDIVVKCDWSYFEKWMAHGIAMVHEIRANDMPPTHPIRMEWIKIIDKSNNKVQRQLTSYINSGFCGISKPNFKFINDWKAIMDVGIEDFNLRPALFMPAENRTDPFFAADQDALNMAAMLTECSISEMGPEGMDFIHGGWTMSHAAGSIKPWKKQFILESLKGYGTTLQDRCFWDNVHGPITIYSNTNLKLKRFSILLATFINRFYRKN